MKRLLLFLLLPLSAFGANPSFQETTNIVNATATNTAVARNRGNGTNLNFFETTGFYDKNVTATPTGIGLVANGQSNATFISISGPTNVIYDGLSVVSKNRAFYGNGAGLSNAVDIIAGANITVTPGADLRNYTIASTASGSGATSFPVTNMVAMVMKVSTNSTPWNNTYSISSNSTVLGLDGVVDNYQFSGNIWITNGTSANWFFAGPWRTPDGTNGWVCVTNSVRMVSAGGIRQTGFLVVTGATSTVFFP